MGGRETEGRVEGDFDLRRGFWVIKVLFRRVRRSKVLRKGRMSLVREGLGLRFGGSWRGLEGRSGIGLEFYRAWEGGRGLGFLYGIYLLFLIGFFFSVFRGFCGFVRDRGDVL